MTNKDQPTVTAEQMSPAARRMLPLLLAALGMLGPFSIDTVFPSFAYIQEDFSVDALATQQLVSAYLGAFAIMSLFHGPMSDALGRKPVILGGLAVYAGASVVAAMAPTFEVLIICRVVQGMSAGGSMVVSRTMIRDLYSGAEAQRLMSIVMMIFGLAPAIAPIFGGFLVSLWDWEAQFWFLTIFATLSAVGAWLLLPETLPKASRSPLRPASVVAGVLDVAKTPRFHRLAWSAGFLFGGFFLYIGSAALIVEDLLGRSDTEYWVLFVPLIGGMVTGSFISGRAADRVNTTYLVLAFCVWASVSSIINVLITAVFHADGLPWVMIGPAMIGLGVGVAYPNMQLAVLDVFPKRRGSAASGITFVGLMVNTLTTGALATTVASSLGMLAIVAAGMMLVSTALWVWHMKVDRPQAV